MQNKNFALFLYNKRTKRRSITRSEMKMIDKRFPLLFKIMLETGNTPEKVHDDLGFPKYEVSGVVYDTNDGIYREWMQRAKVLNHWFQKHFRLERQNKIEDKMEKKEQDKKRAINDIIKLNEEAEIKLLL